MDTTFDFFANLALLVAMVFSFVIISNLALLVAMVFSFVIILFELFSMGE